MKVIALIVLCAFAAVQARHTALVKSTRAAAELGENPWVVHLRIAVSTSGLLETCAGTLISSTWIITTADCVEDARFIWARYGAVDVVSPPLVTENSITRPSPDSNVALININRVVHSTDNIAPAALPTEGSVLTGKLCTFGADEDGRPGELLTCAEQSVEAADGLLIASDAGTTEFDLGAGLVSDGVLYGILSATNDGDATFVDVRDQLEWIQSETGIGSEDSDVEGDNLVHFVN